MAEKETPVPAEESTQTQPTSTTINDLFGNNDKNEADGDVFAQLGSTVEEQDPFAQIGEHDHDNNTLPEPSREDQKFFADASQSAEAIPSQQDQHPSPPPPGELPAPPSEESLALPENEESATVTQAKEDQTTQPITAEQDFSDLLAEFEAENQLVPNVPLATGEEDTSDALTSSFGQMRLDESASHAKVNSQKEKEQDEILQVPLAASALFTDDPSDSFADLIPQDDQSNESRSTTTHNESTSKADSPSPVPSLSIEHTEDDIRPAGLGIDGAGDTSIQSMFSDASNWLDDTTIDDSMQIDSDNHSATREVHKQDDGHELLDFEIPQGWYDENGEWHWYTDEEKEQVKQTMLGQGSWGAEADNEVHDQVQGEVPNTPSAPYSPALRASVSENAARRTPQPETPSTFSSNSYDPYAPSTAQQTSASSSYPLTGTSQYTSSSSAYEPYSGVSSNAPYSSTSSYDPYTPQPSTQPSYNSFAQAPLQQPNPYAPATNSSNNPYAPAAAVSGSSTQPPQAVPKPAPPKPQVQRMASNAYDPPFLKPQKSFVRIASASPAAGPPSFGLPPSMAMSPPQASSTPPPPPSGPPRRTKTEGRPPSRGPAFAAPPKLLERAETTPSFQQHDMSAYEAPPRRPSVPTSHGMIEHQEPFSPPKPPYRPPPSAFDPPLPQPSYRAPSRTASAASHHHFAPPPQPLSHPPQFAPPPKASESPYAAPRPLSRGPPSRQPSPMFAARPPSRPDITQRMRSPPSSSQSLGVEQLLSPPVVHSHMPEHQAKRSLDEDRPFQAQYGESQADQDDAFHRQPTQPDSHLSPPILSRRYDEDGEDGDMAEDAYTPVTERPPPAHDYRMPTRSPAQPIAPKLDYSSYGRHIAVSEDPYAPSSLGLHTQQSPAKRSQPSTSPYPPYTPFHADEHNDQEDPYKATRQSADYSSDPYAPAATGTSPSRASTTSYEPSIYSPSTASKPLGIPPPSNPYAPGPARTASPAYSPAYGISPPANNYFQPMHASSHSTDDTYIPQQVLEQKPVSEDPLGRTTLAARNAPIAVFGFGGTLITAFPGAAESGNFHKGHSRVPSYGYASGRGQLWIRTISEVAAPAALKNDYSAFPGPLVFDPSTPKGAAGDKKKREAVLAYLTARAEEIEKGLPYLKSSANKARREEEGKLVLIKVLKALVLGEGKLAGNPEVEEAVREALANPTSPTITTTAPVGTISAANFGSSLYPPVSSSSSATSVAASSAQLTRISSLLALGNRADAALYAADQGLWSHALVISSNSVKDDLWREIVARFTSSEIGDRPQGTAGIKASYLLLGGANPSLVDDLVKAATITDDPSNDQWREVIGSILFNAKATELACLDELGAKFLDMGLINAAHACSLLSPLSPFFDVTNAAYERAITLTRNPKDGETMIFAEIAEYARSLVKTDVPHFAGLIQLLPYKLARAWRLAELGETELAQKYCTAIELGSKPNKNGLSVLSPAYVANLEDLLERLTGKPSIDPPNALGSGRKSTKSGLDKIGSWVGGGLTRFIAGEENGSTSSAPSAKDGKPAGPFAQFSTISTGGSGAPSRTTSIADLNNATAGNGYLGVQSISRTTSPASHTSPQWGQQSTVPSYGNGGQSSTASSLYGGDNYAQNNNDGSGYSPWSGNNDNDEGGETPQTYNQDGHSVDLGDEGEFINPMAQHSFGASSSAPSSNYAPTPATHNKSTFEDEDEDDLGFGNAALSRGRTPMPPTTGEDANGNKTPPAKDSKADPKKDEPAPPAKPEQKSSWLGKFWGGKKEAGEHKSGPVKANLGEESSMIFDPETKRWVVKGAKPEASGPSAPPPPPRAQTASPSRSAKPPDGGMNNNRASSATPPSGHRPPPPTMSSMPPPVNKGLAFAEGPDGSIKRMKSSLNESLTASDLPPSSSAGGPPTGSPAGGPPKPPSGPPSRTSSSGPPSIDDLLSRPPSKRPASAAAKKGARNRYVDVFQQPGE